MEIKLTAKQVKSALMYKLDCDIFENWCDDVISRAGLKKADMLKKLMADEKFLKRLAKAVAESLDELLLDAAVNVTSDVVEGAVSACEKAFDVLEREDAKEQEIRNKLIEQTMLENRIKDLEARGYVVTKRSK